MGRLMTSSASFSLTGRPPSATGKSPIGRLPVQRLGVIDRGRNALRLQRGRERVAPAGGKPDRVLRPDRGLILGDARHDRDVGKAGGVARGRRIARGDLVRKDLELLEQHRRLDRVEPRGEADARGIVFVAALAMHAEAAQPRGQIVVVGEDRAAVAIAAERLGRKEAGRGGRSAGLAAFEYGAELAVL